MTKTKEVVEKENKKEKKLDKLVVETQAQPSTQPQTKPKKKRFLSKRPGRLSGSILFELHTADAQQVFAGYSTKDAVSLLQFGGRMTHIWSAAEKDDPYADWYLLKVYDGIVRLRNQLAVAIQDYQAQMTQGQSNLALEPFTSEKPVVKSLWFRTQYGYLGASVIADFDKLIRTVLTANRIGVLLEKSHETIRDEWLNKIVILFKFPFKYQSFEITRADVEADNALAKNTQEVLGVLPESVLAKTLRSPFAPAIQAPNILKEEAVKKTDHQD
jgi:integrating conjugative element protein (TIGR03761 family)